MDSFLFKELDGISFNRVERDQSFETGKVLSFLKGFDCAIIDKKSLQADMFQDVSDVLISKGIINWNWDELEENASNINDSPLGSVLGKDTNEFVRAIFIGIPEVVVDNGTSDLMGLLKELIIVFILNDWLIIILDNSSKGGFLGILLAGVKHDVFHGSEVFSGRLDNFVFKSWETINGSLALLFLRDWLSVEDWLTCTHVT